MEFWDVTLKFLEDIWKRDHEQKDDIIRDVYGCFDFLKIKCIRCKFYVYAENGFFLLENNKQIALQKHTVYLLMITFGQKESLHFDAYGIWGLW